MKNDNPSEQFTFWKRPWGKWIVLLAAAVHFICFSQNISDYQEVSSIMGQSFSTNGFEKWKIEQSFRCSIYGIATVMFLGEFLIGTLSHRKRTAEMAGGLFLLIVGISWLIIGFILGFESLDNGKVFWFLLNSCMIIIGIYYVLKSWRSEKT